MNLDISQISCCLSGPPMAESEAVATAALFKALADPTRVQIFNLLANSPEPVCVCDMNADFDLSQPTMSHHLKKLTEAGFVDREQRGTWAYFSINKDALKRLRDVVQPKGTAR